jgi:hypothetical protein
VGGKNKSSKAIGNPCEGFHWKEKKDNIRPDLGDLDTYCSTYLILFVPMLSI